MSLQKTLITIGVGIVVGILIAPAKGADTRKKIRKGYEDISDGIQNAIDTCSDLVSSFTERSSHSVNVVNETSAVASPGSEAWTPKRDTV